MENANWHCRIGKVTRKDGRGSLHVISSKTDPSATELLKTFHEHAAFLAGQFADDAAGFAIVMWDRAGRFSRGRSATAASPYGKSLVPAIVAEILRRDTVADVVCGVLNGTE